MKTTENSRDASCAYFVSSLSCWITHVGASLSIVLSVSAFGKVCVSSSMPDTSSFQHRNPGRHKVSACNFYLIWRCAGDFEPGIRVYFSSIHLHWYRKSPKNLPQGWREISRCGRFLREIFASREKFLVNKPSNDSIFSIPVQRLFQRISGPSHTLAHSPPHLNRGILEIRSDLTADLSSWSLFTA